MANCIVVFSGGQDSTTCLMWAKQNFEQVTAITFNYGQRHKLEIECAKQICEDQGIEHIVLDMSLLNGITSNALTRSEIEVQAGSNGSLPSTFVDGRNMIFLTFAAVVAKQRGISHIVTGVCQTDFSGYPDCRDVFIKSLNVSLNLAMDYLFVIHTPLMWLTKSETWKLADSLNVLDYVRDNTLTCYNGIKGEGCGTCPACLLRNAGLKDYLKGKEAFE